jgi:hypothetical protein
VITLNSAPTAWASDTNYSAGADPWSGTATKVDPGSGRFAQGWRPSDTLPAQHLNYHLNAVTASLADIISKVSNRAVDGVDGGEYTLASPLRFEGAAVQFGATVNIDTGAAVVTEGAIIVGGGGVINITTDGAISMTDDVTDLSIDDLAGAFRLTLTPQSIQPDTGGTDPAWLPRLSGTALVGTPVGWYQADVNAAFCIAFPVNLPAGDDIVSVSVVSTGAAAGVDHAAKPTGGDLPTYALVRVSTSGVGTVIASRADAAADLSAYNVAHTTTLQNGASGMSGTLPHTVDEDYAYYVVVHGETGSDAEPGKFGILAVTGTTVARSYRSFVVTL